ncbi:hypothetical protein VTN02DRAFT_4453 [Thermoascus thermophilus]
MDGPGNHFYMNNTNPFRRTAMRPQTMYALGRTDSLPSYHALDSQPRTVDDSNVHETNPYRRRHHHSSRSKTRVRPDVIDRLDDVGDFQYHHEGPYDAVYPERNRNSKKSPIEALKESNEEALRATPIDKIMDSIERHRPLDGVAFYPPGHTDREGRTYNYTESTNMVAEEYGNFVRVPGFKFTDEDFQNDPFYQDSLRQPKRRPSLRRVLGTLRRPRNRKSMLN